MRRLVAAILVLAAGSAAAAPGGRQLSPAERSAVIALVKAELNDPESAQFRWLKLRKKSANEYCGWVNAKNRMGGYVGFRAFKVSGSVLDDDATFSAQSVLMSPGPSTPLSERLEWGGACRDYDMSRPPPNDERP